jgi:hypothetical protein
VIISLLVVVVGYLCIWQSQKVLTKRISTSSVELAGNIIDKIDRIIYYRTEQVQAYAKGPAQEHLLTVSNLEADRLHNIKEFIREQDQLWRSASEDQLTEFMQKIINNNLSEEIRNKFEIKQWYNQRYGYVVFGEAFITNKYGASVARTQKTSDCDGSSNPSASISICLTRTYAKIIPVKVSIGR